MSTDPVIVWAPQPGPQKALVDCPLPEVFFGGARGGGKTDCVLGKHALKGERFGRHFNGLFFRRELPMADDAIERSQAIFGRLGWKWNASKYSWRSRRGARLRFRPLESVSDAEKYQGQNVTDAAVEEAGNYPDPRPIDRLNGILRSAAGVPTQLILTGNPGGPGQQWLKARYVDPAPLGRRILSRQLANGRVHRFVFIPSKVHDNRILLARDPEYVNRLHLVGSAELVRAWLEGDWNAVEGAFFDCWRDALHVIRPVALPDAWLRFAAIDWGSYHPFSVGWYAVVQDPWEHPDGPVLPRGALVRYREWYGMQDGQVNVGLKLHAEMVAQGIAMRERGEKIAYRVIDPSAFKQDGGPSIAERMMTAAKLSLMPADNRRVGEVGRMGGWDQVRSRLIGQDGKPMLYLFATGAHLIRTLPALQHDDSKPEDVDTEAEDHAPDELRYACMSRPWVPQIAAKVAPKFEYAAPSDGTVIVGNVPISELIKRMERRREET